MVFNNIVSGCNRVIASTDFVFGDFGGMVFNIIYSDYDWDISAVNPAFGDIVKNPANLDRFYPFFLKLRRRGTR
ncbi:MAG: hypothetical protein Q7J30_01765 [Candidatus Azambacteria bacterium]|nr:hypothetical protein [Candidatus Azambacteria bacterium]